MAYAADKKLPETFFVKTLTEKSQYAEETFKGHK